MLGQFARKQKELPEQSVASTVVYDLIKEHWTQKRTPSEVSLAKKDPIWREWWIGASAIHKVCPRMFALAAARGVEGMEGSVFPAETLWLFDQGHAYHDLFQQKVLASFPTGILLGRWKNDSGVNTEYKNDVPEGMIVERGWGPCPDGRGWKYDETKIRIPDYRMVVKIDTILDIPGDGLEVVEIKTEKQEAKDDLNPMLGGRPRPQHIEQTHVGMWATGIQRARIIYVFKGAPSLKTSLIEHIVPRNEALIEEIKARALACVDAVKAIEAIDNMPDRKIAAENMPRLPECQMKSKGKPKYCDGRDLCFGVRKKRKESK